MSNLTKFNLTLSNLIDDLIRVFPDYTNLEIFKEKFNLLKSSNPRLILTYFKNTIYPYKSQIEAKKEEDLIFIKKEVENIISNLNTSKSCSKILLVIVNDILDLQKLEKGKLNLIEKTFKIKDLIDILERSILHKIEEASLSVKFKIESNCKNIKIYSDINRLVQIGINFLINAFKYTTKGEITLFINIINNYFVLKVKDTGIGIKEDLKNQIFINKFIGENNNSLPGLRGIGIGLYLCKRLSILLGGNVKFESKVNKGSTFSLEIPISKLKIKNLEELNNEDGDERNGDERNIEIITI